MPRGGARRDAGPRGAGSRGAVGPVEALPTAGASVVGAADPHRPPRGDDGAPRPAGRHGRGCPRARCQGRCLGASDLTSVSPRGVCPSVRSGSKGGCVQIRPARRAGFRSHPACSRPLRLSEPEGPAIRWTERARPPARRRETPVGLPGPTARCYPQRRSSAPRATRAPPSMGPPRPRAGASIASGPRRAAGRPRLPRGPPRRSTATLGPCPGRPRLRPDHGPRDRLHRQQRGRSPGRDRDRATAHPARSRRQPSRRRSRRTARSPSRRPSGSAPRWTRRPSHRP